jgi:hypothetical protein
VTWEKDSIITINLGATIADFSRDDGATTVENPNVIRIIAWSTIAAIMGIRTNRRNTATATSGQQGWSAQAYSTLFLCLIKCYYVKSSFDDRNFEKELKCHL